MNNIIKNLLLGVTVTGACFGLGYGAKWVSNHEWSSKSEENSIVQLERDLSRLETDFNHLSEEMRNRYENNPRINRIESDVRKIKEELAKQDEQIDRLNTRLKKAEKYRVTEEKVAQSLQEMSKQMQRTIASQYKSQKEQKEDDDDEKSDYDGKSCHSQAACGGKNSGYFCNYGGHHTKNVCEKTNAKTTRVDGILYYYNQPADLKKWCRRATESADDRANPQNCNWGYLSYSSAQAWCESIGKELLDPHIISDNCEDFDFLPKANDDQQYWTTNMSVIHTGQKCSIQNMVRGDGYCYAGGVICK